VPTVDSLWKFLQVNPTLALLVLLVLQVLSGLSGLPGVPGLSVRN
jgi:hypothetical protein